ncbi:uncharacterized protein LOC109504405 isoform X1 [Harpegnathos saltator]|uniref:uncharacterized protein LOC109504405 isoform X1 n=1 Tax=Harpegnathos saltator TaxID=610380 RepID=UPI000DBED720|nr:uncharacterized protein LOC109504405 isoform X1 [Harpegnathos saltator]
MDVVMRYYNLNRIFLLCNGLWPYQTNMSKKIHLVCILFVFMQFLIFQSMIFITVDFSILLLLEVLSTLFISLVFVYKYGTIYFNMDKVNASDMIIRSIDITVKHHQKISRLIATQVKLFFERIQYDWDTLKDPVEYEIMKRQANIAQWYTKYFTLIMYVITFLFITMHYVPLLLDAVVPLAKPRPRRILVVGEMFIDQHKYFHMVLLNITISSLIGMTTVIAAETLLMVLVQHVCGLLKVTSYRITRAFDNDCSPVLRHGKKCIVCTKLASAVNIHRSAIMFADCVRDCFGISYLILILFGVASLSINLYRVSSIRFFFMESL